MNLSKIQTKMKCIDEKKKKFRTLVLSTICDKYHGLRCKKYTQSKTPKVLHTSMKC